MIRRWEVWCLVWGKRIKTEPDKRTFTKWGAKRWANTYKAPIWNVPDIGLVPQWTWEITRG